MLFDVNVNEKTLPVDLSARLMQDVDDSFKTCHVSSDKNSHHDYFHECFLMIISLIRGNNNNYFAFTLEELNAVCKLVRSYVSTLEKHEGNYVTQKYGEQWGSGNGSFIVSSFKCAEEKGWVARVNVSNGSKYDYYKDQWILLPAGLIESANYVM